MKETFVILILIALLSLVSCKSHEAGKEEETAPEEVQTPVTVTRISREPLYEYVELNAMSSFLQSSIIKATANGYIKTANVKPGEYVSAGQLAFIIQTKEARALGNTINDLDPSFKFSGLIKISATHTGFISSVDHQQGDYVQDGEQLAILSDSKSFGFLLNLPYELRPFLHMNKTIDLELPDHTHLAGSIAQIMPAVDSVSQTQGILIKVQGQRSIPQNLIARVRLVRQAKINTNSLPKQAVLTDESQSEFWVMKLIDSVTAVKTPVIKGMETSDRVEILQPALTAGDRIVLKGNYGLPDTAKVKIVKE